MATRLSTAFVVGALFSMSSLTHADLPLCSGHIRPVVVAPEIAPATVPVNHHPTFHPSDTVSKHLMLRNSAALGTLIDCQCATLGGSRGTTNKERDTVEFMSWNAAASGPDLWDRPVGATALLSALAQAQATEPLPTSKIAFKKPVLYSLSLMTAGFGVFVVSGMFENRLSIDSFVESYTSPPRFDDNPLLLNFVLHPLWGSETYLRAREANFGIAGSIAFSLGASIAWEYLYESWVVHPSTQDLLVTTGIGWMIGEGRYYLKNKLGPKHYWWIDPIHTTLEYFNIVVNRDREGNTRTTLRLTWKF